MSNMPASELADLLGNAYRPCPKFGLCNEAVWDPAAGHLPRDSVGARGELCGIEVILVFSQLGTPYPDEGFDPDSTPEEFLTESIRRTFRAFNEGANLFHRNVRWFLNEVFPGLSFEEQLERAWLTEGRLCSIANEIGKTTDRRCAQEYLAQQIELIPNATIVGFGGKAQKYLGSLGVDFVSADAMAPPGANHRPARSSWEAAISAVKARVQP